MFNQQDDMLKVEESQRKLIQHLGDGEYDNGAGVLNEDGSGDTDVNTVELSDGEYLDATSEDGDSEDQHNTDSDAEESESGYTDWSNNLSEGEILVTGYSDAESDGGEVCDDEILNDEDSPCVFEDCISGGEIPNAISKRYLSNGELYPTCDNELKYLLNTEDGWNGRNEYGEGKTIKYIDNLCLVDEMCEDVQDYKS